MENSEHLDVITILCDKNGGHVTIAVLYEEHGGHVAAAIPLPCVKNVAE
jgi:hypothetical protein